MERTADRFFTISRDIPKETKKEKPKKKKPIDYSEVSLDELDNDFFCKE
jgi:hypothetical protein